MEGLGLSFDWQGHRAGQTIALSSAALWGSHLSVAGPENQNQQPPHSEEVSSAWQPEEAFWWWAMCRISKADLLLIQSAVDTLLPQRHSSKALQQWSVWTKCWPTYWEDPMFPKASVWIHVDITHEELLWCYLVVVKTAIMITSLDIFLTFNKTK